MTYTQRQGQIQSWTPGAVRTKKRKGNLSQQPRKQWIKSPQWTWCTLHLWNTWIDNESSQNWGSGLWEQRHIYIFSFFSLCECVCVCFFVWFCLYRFAFNICPRVLSVRFFFFFLVYLVLVIIGRFVFCFCCSLFSFFFLNYFLIFLVFNNYFLF